MFAEVLSGDAINTHDIAHGSEKSILFSFIIYVKLSETVLSLYPECCLSKRVICLRRPFGSSESSNQAILSVLRG